MKLVDDYGKVFDYALKGVPATPKALGKDASRVIYSAAHVVANPLTNNDPSGRADVDWEATMKFRAYLSDLGLGIAEAMDTAQRGMGLDWQGAYELIRRTKENFPHALVANGVGTDQLDLSLDLTLDDVRRAYFEQLDAVQSLGADVILMASRGLARVARSPDDYVEIYNALLSACERPAILHWLGPMFDPQLRGYWGSENFEDALETVLAIINANKDKVDGIKISLLDKDKEIILRDQLPDGVRMYTGDDFNYPELIAGDGELYSDALLGIFDPLAPLVADAVGKLDQGNKAGFHQILDPTVPLAREIFRAPTQYYKTGVVFLAWLNGFQDHFIMLSGAQAMRPLPYFCKLFTMADEIGLLREPELADERMNIFVKLYGLE